MTKIKIGEAIEFDEKEYVCFYEFQQQGINYLFLITQTEPIDVKIAKYDIKNSNDSIIVIGNKEEKQQILDLFYKKIQN